MGWQGDKEAIHDDVAGEINAITEKVTPTVSDLVVIESAADGYAKRKTQLGNLPGGGSSAVTILHGSTPQSDGSLRFEYGVDSSGRPTYTAAGTTDTEAIVVLIDGRPVAREITI